MESLGLARAEVSQWWERQRSFAIHPGLGGHACKAAGKAARQLKESTQQRSQSIGMASVSGFVATMAIQTLTILRLILRPFT